MRFLLRFRPRQPYLWTVAGRPLRPLHFGLMVSTGTLAIVALVTNDNELALTTWGDLMGAVALAGCGLLLFAQLAGDPVKARHLSEWGLLVTTFVWAYRTALAALNSAGGIEANPAWAGFAFGIGWTFAAGGAWLLERATGAGASGVLQ